MSGQIDQADGAGFVGARLRLDVVRLVLAQLAWVLGRSRAPYPFIDTKFDLVAGRNFAETDKLRGPSAIYCWIQGRGLEALAEHARWLEREAAITPRLRAELLAAIRSLLTRVMKAMEAARARHAGRLPFLMTPEGVPLVITPEGVRPVGAEAEADGGRSLSDLFYARGLMAAATWLRDGESARRAEAILLEVLADIRAGRFVSGQLALDPRNPVAAVPGRQSHAGRMIALGACTLFWRETGNAVYRDIGIEFIDHVLAHHVQPRDGEFRVGDFWEFVDADGRPWEADGRRWSDPGHATEFAGLAFAHLGAGGLESALREGRAGILRRVLLRNFENGFTGRGVVKAFDLRTRRAINTDLPWWSLPETMRAAALACRFASTEERACFSDIWLCCWSAFTEGYVRRDRGLLAVQCLTAEGTVSSAIPATPDLDPGYHTGLALLGCLDWAAEVF